jgi:DNA-binding MarR family transcriptional regulator
MGKPKVSDLRSHLGFLMRFVSNSVSHSFARKIESQGVTVAEWVILREMYEHSDKTSPSNIIQQTGLTKGAVSKLIDRLCAKKLVTRLSAKQDRRFQEIGLTEKGRALVPGIARAADMNDREYFGCLGLEERRELDRILKIIIQKNKLSETPVN